MRKLENAVGVGYDAINDEFLNENSNAKESIDYFMKERYVVPIFS